MMVDKSHIFHNCLQFALRAVEASSAGVRISTVGHVTSASCTDPVTTSLTTHVDASVPFLLTDDTASLLISTVSCFELFVEISRKWY